MHGFFYEIHYRNVNIGKKMSNLDRFSTFISSELFLFVHFAKCAGKITSCEYFLNRQNSWNIYHLYCLSTKVIYIDKVVLARAAVKKVDFLRFLSDRKNSFFCKSSNRLIVLIRKNSPLYGRLLGNKLNWHVTFCLLSSPRVLSNMPQELHKKIWRNSLHILWPAKHRKATRKDSSWILVINRIALRKTKWKFVHGISHMRYLSPSVLLICVD